MNVRASGDTAENILLPASSSDWFGGEAVMVSGAASFRELHRPPAAPQAAARYQDEILTSLLITDAGAVGQMLLEHVQ